MLKQGKVYDLEFRCNAERYVVKMYILFQYLNCANMLWITVTWRYLFNLVYSALKRTIKTYLWIIKYLSHACLHRPWLSQEIKFYPINHVYVQPINCLDSLITDTDFINTCHLVLQKYIFQRRNYVSLLTIIRYKYKNCFLGEHSICLHMNAVFYCRAGRIIICFNLSIVYTLK